jgi:cytoskeletal protein CcmA (bactofilin family)
MKMGKPEINEVKALNTFAQDTKLKGNIESRGDLRIDGQLEGTLNCLGRVVIGPDAKITGTLSCKNAEIFGNIEGDIIVSDLLSLKSSAVIMGNLTMGKLSVEPGAKFNGQCKMAAINGESLENVKILNEDN